MNVKISKIASSVAVLIFSISIACAGVDENNATVNETAIESLIQDLADQNVSIKVNAVKALVEIGEPAVETLIQALEDNNPDVRENSAHALGKIGDERAVGPLIELLCDNKYWEVEHAARHALANIGEPALDSLVSYINDQNGSLASRIQAVYALGGIGEPAVEPLVQLLTQNILCVEAASSLKDIGEPAVEPLIQILENDENQPQVRAQAVQALGGIGDKRAIEPLTKALNNKNERVRILAKSGLEKIENKGKYGIIATYGKEREFFIEDEKREWYNKLDEIGKGARDDMLAYHRPDGPVISYGYNYQGYLTVGFLAGSEINESLMDEIYEIFNRQAMQMGIDDVQVVFQFKGQPVPDAPDEGPAPDTLNIPGFTSITLLMAFLGLRRMR